MSFIKHFHVKKILKLLALVCVKFVDHSAIFLFTFDPNILFLQNFLNKIVKLPASPVFSLVPVSPLILSILKSSVRNQSLRNVECSRVLKQKR